MLKIEIDSGSGFCFGVTTAIRKAEEELAHGQTLYCLGDIVHNGMECERLRQMGLVTINHEQMARLHHVKVLLRAHGEPPQTYELARQNDIEIIDATCPVVLQLQKRIKKQHEASPPDTSSSRDGVESRQASIVIFGKKGHAEVLGLVGQTAGHAIVIESFDEVKKLHLDHDIYLYSQTTKSLDEFHRIIDYIQRHISPGATFRSFDTICRSVANRMPNITQFATRHDLILFVCGRKSSNGKVLFNECQRVNANTHLIEGPDEISKSWLEGIQTVGICGATSTPKWLMEQCRDAIRKLFLFLLLFTAFSFSLPSSAQQVCYGKLSPWLRHIVRSQQVRCQSRQAVRTDLPSGHSPRLIAFVQLDHNASDTIFRRYGCQSLANYGPLHIASIPLGQLSALTLNRHVSRIEASPSPCRALTDSMAVHLHATSAHTGQGLPQAYTGQGVVMGIMDVGFDLTHPTFLSRDLSRCRIQHFWDQLSADTVGSPFPVGRDYTSPADILAIAHSRDGLDLTHGTHTLGIAAGSGYDSPYRGMAPDADICLVANAVSDDLVYIDSADVYKYTFATDALGFKYIFDYAASVGKPCVISFSEGSPQDFVGYDQLYYAMLDSLTGPGRILVAAAGNEGHHTSWLHKPRGRHTAGTFLLSSSPQMLFTVKSADPFLLRFVTYGAPADTLVVSPADALLQPDSMLQAQAGPYQLEICAYPSCYVASELCYDVTIQSSTPTIGQPELSVELMGADADVELWRQSGRLVTSGTNPQLSDGESTHNVHSPSSAPCVISVGATTYRPYIVSLAGDTMSYWPGTGGQLTAFSSRGPTMDGRIKPDCVAPGNNIISAYSSYYLEHHPDAADIRWDVAHFPFRGRTYAWNSNSGTSMSAPAVGGAIALWLQACPTLSPADVLSLLSHTCSHADTTLTYPNNLYGYGQIDVYAGLLHLLGLSSLPALPSQPTAARLSVTPGRLHIHLGHPTSVPIILFDLSGRPVLSAQLPAGDSPHHTLPLPPLPAGVYAVRVGDGSTLIRIR